MEVAFPLCLILIAILFLKYVLYRGTNSKPSRKQPPSPWGLPVIGNLHQLGRLPHRSLRSLSRRHGPLMLLHFGRFPVLVATSMETAEAVMKTHDREFADRIKTKVVDKLLFGGRDVIFSPYGEYWRQMKSVCILHLLSNKMVRQFQNVREEEINLMIKNIEKATSSSSLIDLSELFVTLTKDVVCRVALGRKYSGEEDGKNFKDLIHKLVELAGEYSFRDYIPSLSWIDRIRGLDAKTEQVAKKFDDLMERIVEAHSQGDEESLDFVNVLLSIQREKAVGFEISRSDLKAMIMDMFVAGTDTTSTLLEWAMTELIRHPECMKRLRHEIRTTPRQKSYVSEEEVEQMKYLGAVIKEVLRLHPPLPMILGRQLARDIKLNGYELAAGTQVIINIWAIQRDTALWGPDAEEFRPERHLDSSLDFRGQNFKFLPFGAGRRLCPGIGFALALSQLTLANVVDRFDWKAEETVPPGDESFLAETSGLAASRKFPLIAFPTFAS